MGETVSNRWMGAMSGDCHMGFPAGKRKGGQEASPTAARTTKGQDREAAGTKRR